MKIKSGDTLSQIAKANGMTLKALLGANPQIKNANQIRVGQTITIPPKAMQAGSANKNPYAGMTRTQMALMDVKNKDKTAQEAATRSMQTQSKAGAQMAPTKKKKNTGSSMNMSKFEEMKAKMKANRKNKR